MKLTLNDRCDASATGACAAKHVLEMPSGNRLYFCDHHYTKHANALLEQGATELNTEEQDSHAEHNQETANVS